METTLNPYLAFNGQARQAMEFYQSILGGDLSLQTFGEAGMRDYAEDQDRIVHARLVTGAITFMASDAPSDRIIESGENVSLCLQGADKAGLTGVFAKLAEDGDVTMPLEKQFWGDVFGMVTDKFGIKWMVNISARD